MTKRLVHIRGGQLKRARRWRLAALALLSLPVVVLTASSALAKVRGHGREAATARGHSREATARHLQKVADAIRERLGIARAVTVAIVARNPYLRVSFLGSADPQ